MKKIEDLSNGEREIFNFLDEERGYHDSWFTCGDICKATDRCWNQSSYRMLNRLIAYGLVEHSFRFEKGWTNKVMIYRRKKNE